MDTNSLSFDSFRGPKYRRLYEALDRAIRSGLLKPGAKLPPVRDLAWQLKITPGTVARAYQLATDDGLLEATVGRGTFVRSTERSLANMPINFIAQGGDSELLNFRNGHTVEVGQSEVITDLTREILDTKSIEFGQYVRDEAMRGCRVLANKWLRAHGVSGNAEDLVLTHGAHSAVMVALNAILHGKEPVIVTTNLVYPGFRQSARISRATLIGVDSDGEGLLPDELEQVCRSHRPQALLVSSNVHNPTCVATSRDRRLAIAALARKYDFQIIEDDVYGTLITSRPDGFDQFCPERTWHATSLSKCLAAGLRIGFLQCPPQQGELGIRVMQGMSLSISQLLTRLVERLFETGVVDDFTHRIASDNTARVEIARTVLKDWNVQSQYGVNLVWIRKPDRWTSGAFLGACEKSGVLVAPGDSFTIPGNPAPNSVRLTLSGAPDYQSLRAGLDAINDTLASAPRLMLA